MADMEAVPIDDGIMSELTAIEDFPLNLRRFGVAQLLGKSMKEPPGERQRKTTAKDAEDATRFSLSLWLRQPQAGLGMDTQPHDAMTYHTRTKEFK